MLGDVEPRLQLRELLLDLVGVAAPERGKDGSFRLSEWFEVTPDARRIGARACRQAVDSGADPGEPVVNGGGTHRASCVSLTTRRLASASASALPGAAAVLPAPKSAL